MPDEPPTRPEPDPATSRERILRAAAELFARQGFAATPVRRIAEEAGVAQGLLYTYFDGKQGVLRAIFERGMTDVRASWQGAETAGSPADAIEALVRAAHRIVGQNLAFWRILYQLRVQPDVVEGIAQPLAAWSEEILGHLGELLRAAGADDPAVEARLLFAAIDGTSQHYAQDPEAYPLEEVTRALVRRFVPRPEPPRRSRKRRG